MSEPLYKRVKLRCGKVTLNLEFYEHPQAEAVIIFLPGTGCSASFYHPFLQTLSWKGYTLIGLDPRGHGLSTGERGDWSVEEVFEDIKAVKTTIQKEIPVGIMGSSQGGFLAFYAIHEIDGFSFAICHNGGYLSELFLTKTIMFKFFEKFARRFPSIKVPHLHVNWRYVFKERKKLNWLFKNPLFVSRYSLRALYSLFTYSPENPPKCPVLLITGEREYVVPNFIPKRAKKKWNEFITYHEIKGAGHMLPLEYTERTIIAINEWLRSKILKHKFT
jgi:pimeloyl-ACP methyl ester carboxylesterase